MRSSLVLVPRQCFTAMRHGHFQIVEDRPFRHLKMLCNAPLRPSFHAAEEQYSLGTPWQSCKGLFEKAEFLSLDERILDRDDVGGYVLNLRLLQTVQFVCGSRAPAP